MNYYNEFDPKAAAWLLELIAQGHIPPGEVDTRSITQVSPNDLTRYTQCHFFAGIGGWSYALELAGWPATRPIWTGSCPCQPFSAAGKGLGNADERHLWPAFFGLIRECRPVAVFGEQVASAIGHGWLDGICADLEGEGYAFGAAVLGAHSVSAPQIRQRLYWLADADKRRRKNAKQREGAIQTGRIHADGCEQAGMLADADGRKSCGRELQPCRGYLQQQEYKGAGELAKPNGERLTQRQERNSATPSRPWDSYELLPCTDGKARRIEPGTFPLAHGVSGRVGLLRGYGNAIVPQVAAEFVAAYIDVSCR